MKKFLLFLMTFSVAFFAACGDDDTPQTVSWAAGTADQMIYADDTHVAGPGFTFTAQAPWRAFAESLPGGGVCDWITLSDKEGGAGTFTLGLEILPNNTGTLRTARIVVECGATRIAVQVGQKPLTLDEELEQGGEPNLGKMIVRIEWVKENRDFLTTDFTYDDRGRVLTAKSVRSEGSYRAETECGFTHGDGEILVREQTRRVLEGQESTFDSEYVFRLRNRKCITDYTVRRLNSTSEGLINYNASYELTEFMEKEGYASELYTWQDGNPVTSQVSDQKDSEPIGFGYGTRVNDTNFDLTKILLKIGWADVDWKAALTPHEGVKARLLPEAMTIRYADSTSAEVYRYEYKTDAKGRIAEVALRVDGDVVEVVKLSYK